MRLTLKRFRERFKGYLPCFVACMLFAALVYSVQLTNNLFNHSDGLWHGSYYFARGSEIALGRWLWPYIDLLRCGLSVDPLISILTLACFAGGCVLMLDALSERKGRPGPGAISICLIYMSSVAVCVSLSYRYMSPTFGLAYLLSVAAAWAMLRAERPLVAVAAGGALVALSMGLYQMYLGCTCVVILGWALRTLLCGEAELSRILRRLGLCAASICVGGLLYVAILRLHLLVFDIKMVDYNGANTYSLANTLRKLPASFAKEYESFFSLLFERGTKLTALWQVKGYALAMLLAVLNLLAALPAMLRRDWRRAALYLALIALVPAACHATLLIATDADVSPQMTGPMLLCLPVLLRVRGGEARESRRGRALRRGAMCLAAVVALYGSVLQVEMDQLAMLEGRTATAAMASNILSGLRDEDCLSATTPVCVVGRPADNPMFQTSWAFDRANSYAAFGRWWEDPSCAHATWFAVFQKLCGTDVTLCEGGEYDAHYTSEQARTMPVFPEAGSIARADDGCVLVKVSEPG